MLFFWFAMQVWDPAAPARLEAPLREAVGITEKQSGGNSPAYAEAVSQFARFLLLQNRRDEARDWYRRALSIRESADDLEALAALDPAKAPDLLTRVAALRSQPAPKSRALRRLAGVLEAKGDAKGAGEAYRRAVEASRSASPADFGLAAGALGRFLEEQGDIRGAEPLYRQALAALERAYGPRHPEVGTMLNNLAGAAGAQGRLSEAETLLRRAVTTLESALGRKHERTAAACENLGDLLAATRRTAEAKRYFAMAAEGYRAVGDQRAAAEVERRSAELPR